MQACWTLRFKKILNFPIFLLNLLLASAKKSQFMIPMRKRLKRMWLFCHFLPNSNFCAWLGFWLKTSVFVRDCITAGRAEQFDNYHSALYGRSSFLAYFGCGDCDRAIVHSRRSSPAGKGRIPWRKHVYSERGRANKFIRVGECMFFIGNKYHARAAIIMRNWYDTIIIVEAI